jgi:AcrR family transcriptional regulator
MPRQATARSPASPSLGIRDEVAALKRERTVTAAIELFYERGYENTTLDAVAERLGVTKPFIYAHFSAKTQLLAEICSRGIAASMLALEAALAEGQTPAERLELLARRFVAAVIENQKSIAIFSREEKNLLPQDFERISSLRRDFDRKLSALLEEGAASGDFRIEDPPLASLAIGGLVSWAYVWYRPHGRLSPEALGESVAGLIMAMVQARPDAAPPLAPPARQRGAGRAASRPARRPRAKPG